MGFKKILGVLAVFFLVVSSVYAQVAARELAFDFSLFSGKFYEPKEGEEKIEFEFYNGSYNICGKEKKTIPILVTNKDSKTDSKYALDAVGAGWASLNVKEFSLPKGQSGVVFLELSPEENAIGGYITQINALSSMGNVKRSLLLEINVEKCRSLKLELDKEEDNVCGGVKKQYKGEILNDGKQKSEVELSITGPNWISIDENEFSIDPDSEEKFELSAEIPSHAKGIFNVVVSAAAKNFPAIKSDKELSIEVVPRYDCYKAEVIAEDKIKNDYSNEYIPIRIRNSGIKQAEYEIGLEAPSWVSIGPKKLTVNPGQIGNLNLNINPDAYIPEGNYPVKINVKFEDIAYSKNIEIALSRSQFLKNLKSFFVFYQYYIYVVLLLAVILFLSRRQISGKIRDSYKNYKIRQARLKALEKARKARKLKKTIRQLEKAKFEVKKIKKYSYNKLILFFIGFAIVASILSFSIYNFNFPVSKDFAKSYYAYLIAGVLISAFIIFLIEFYKPLFKLLKKLK